MLKLSQEADTVIKGIVYKFLISSLFIKFNCRKEMHLLKLKVVQLF